MNQSRLRRKIRQQIVSHATRPRLTVYRSLNHLYAQVIDDATGRTLVSANSLKQTGKLLDQATTVGQAIAKLALEKKITAVVFDRNRFPYQGAVKAVAEAARQTGLTI